MGRNYFSKHGGPYFRNDGFSRHPEAYDTKGVSLIGKIRSFFKFPRFGQKK
jgi:hypothetical protein